jgi:hypothetical protein
MILVTKLQILVLHGLLEEEVRKPIVEHKNIWLHRLLAIHIMEFLLIFGLLGFYFILCYLLNTLSKDMI